MDRIGALTTFTYDLVSNLLTITDADSTTKGITKYFYDNRNLLVREEFPTHVAGAAVNTNNYDAKDYAYDAGRRLISRKDHIDTITPYAYDNANRVLTRAYPDAKNDTFAPSPMILTAQSQAGHSGGKSPRLATCLGNFRALW